MPIAVITSLNGLVLTSFEWIATTTANVACIASVTPEILLVARYQKAAKASYNEALRKSRERAALRVSNWSEFEILKTREYYYNKNRLNRSCTEVTEVTEVDVKTHEI